MGTLDLEAMVAGAVTVGLRVSGILVFAPFLGSSSIAPRIKGGLALALTLLLYPICGRQLHFAAPTGWVQMAAAETAIGLLIGLAANLAFETAQMAGNILGVQMGYSLVNLIDPQTQVETPVLALFHQTIALLIFLHLNVHHWLLRAVARSYDICRRARRSRPACRSARCCRRPAPSGWSASRSPRRRWRRR